MNQMNGNTTFRHQNVALLGIAEVEAPVVVTSDELDAELGDVLTKLGLPTGLFQRVAGVESRRQWDTPDGFIKGSAEAGRLALEQAGIEREQIGLLINGSVSRASLEPSVAVSVHNELGLGTQAMNFDITNACLGFVNGMTMAATLIDAGQIDYAMVVAAEETSRLRENTVRHLHREGITRAEYLEEFASLTLGSGAVGAVLGRADAHPEGHRIKGGVTRAATWNHELCVGGWDGMYTDSKALMDNGVGLVMDAWTDAAQDGWDWTDMTSYVTHQVSSSHTNALVKALDLPVDRVPLSFPTLGNVGPAALPITLARQAETLQKGDSVLTIGVGSGLNAALTEIEW
ncbi:MAG: 3-oxoacyl-ACP synthase III [Brevibacterium yomogidense]|uniref:3-oxoacyl-ACP synthase III n=1 Tax=Brevibacterium sp. Mu109 TaxID=1255669 RepID=UPI000C4EF943|nr:3-oxoacyl-ACP synthase III [Brevibacterium sp. Mu109]SMX74582.1 3-oxoacyl-[acyl-carrier-protein] synthase-3 [Brevibacterium sp. Mu109]